MKNNYPIVSPSDTFDISHPLPLSIKDNTLCQDRSGKEYRGRGIWLDPGYAWRIIKDSVGELVLIREPL